MFTTIKKQLMSLITITSMLVMVFGVSAMYANAAAAPNIVSYQGRLLDSNGTPVANASLSMKFFFYDSLAGGTCLWSNSSSDCDGNTPASTVVRAVTLTSGLFSAELGDTAHAIPYTSIPDSVFGDNSSVYLEVEIAGETLTPRKQMLAAPYALNTQTLDGIDSTGFLASTGDAATGIYDFTGAVIGGGSPLVFEGTTANDFESIFSFVDPTADRTLTFQDGSGTLAFMSDITSIWETGGNGIYEDDAAVIVGADAAFLYASGGVNDLKVTDEFEALGSGWVGNNLIIGAATSAVETIASGSFSLGGDDLFVAGDVGVEGSIYTDSHLSVTGTLTANVIAANSDLFLNPNSGTVEFVGISTINIGGNGSNLNYNIIGDNNAGADASMNSDDDLYIEGSFETDGDVRFDGVVDMNSTLNLGGALDMENNIITNIGVALTDFTATGGLTLAGDLAVNGDNITSDGPLAISSNGGTMRLDSSLNSIATNAGVIQADGELRLLSAGANIMSISSLASGPVLVGTTGGQKNITIGNSTGTTSINLDAGTGGIDFDLEDGGPFSIDGDLVVIGGNVDGALAQNDGDLYVIGQFEVDSASQFDADVTFGNSASDSVNFTSHIGTDLTFDKFDPSIIFDIQTVGDTDFWLGVQEDADGADDDLFTIGDGVVPGANQLFTIDTSGNVYTEGNLDVNGGTISSGGDLNVNATNRLILTGSLVSLPLDTVTLGTGIDVSLDGLTTGKGMMVESTSPSTAAGLAEFNHAASYSVGGNHSNPTFKIHRDLVANDGNGGIIVNVEETAPVLSLLNGCTSPLQQPGGNQDVCDLSNSSALYISSSNTSSSNNTGNSIEIHQNGNGRSLYIDSESTTEDVVWIDGSTLTTGDALSIKTGNSQTDGDGFALLIDSDETTETNDIMMIQTNFGVADNNVFKIEADGEVFSDVGFSVGVASTHYRDGYIENTAGDLDLRMSTGLLTFNQDTTIGDDTKSVTIDSSNWDISSAGVLTGFTFDGNAVGNTISGIDANDIADDALNYSKFADAMTLDADTSISAGAYNYTINLDSTGTFMVQDAGVPALTVSNDGDTGITGGLLVGKTLGVTPTTENTGIAITGTNVHTSNLLSLYPTGQTTGHGIYLDGGTTRTSGYLLAINDASNAATSPAVGINVTGTTSQNEIEITYAGGPATGNAISINMGTNTQGHGLEILRNNSQVSEIYIDATSSLTGYASRMLNLVASDDDEADEIKGDYINLFIENDSTATDTAYGQHININQTDTSGAGYGLYVTKGPSQANGDADMTAAILIDNLDTDSDGAGNDQASDILTGIKFQQTGTGRIETGIDLSEMGSPGGYTAIKLGNNFIKSTDFEWYDDGLSTWRMRDSSDNDTLIEMIDTDAFGGITCPSSNCAGFTVLGQASVGDYGVGNIDPNVTLMAGRNFTASANSEASQLYIPQQTITEASAGTHGTISQLGIDQLTIVNAAGNVTNAASLYIEDAPLVPGGATNGPFSIFVNAGESRFDDSILILQDTNNKTALNIVSSAEDTSNGLLSLSYNATTGAQTGNITGLQIDQVMNLTGVSGKHITGSKIYTNDLIASGATNTTYMGYSVNGDSGSLDTTDASATTINWRGLDIEMPAIDTGHADDIVSSYGVSINGGAVTDGFGMEDQVGLMISDVAVDIASAPGQDLKLEAGKGVGSFGGGLDFHAGIGDFDKDGGETYIDSGIGGDSSGGAQAGDGGDFFLVTGGGGNGTGNQHAGNGGLFNLTTGNGGTAAGPGSSGDGGELNIASGAGGAGNSNNLQASGVGGALSLTAGAGGAASNGGVNPAGAGGSLNLYAGDGGHNGLGGGAAGGGNISITAGSASQHGIGANGADGGNISITSGAATLSADNVNGGDVTITTSNGSNMGVSNGGNLILDTGVGSAGGTAGDIVLITGTSTAPVSTFGGDIHIASAGDLNMGAGDGRNIKLGDVVGSQTIDIGGVGAASNTTINIATEAGLSDTITIGNNNTATSLSLVGGDDWSITNAGTANFGGGLVVNSITSSQSTGLALKGADSAGSTGQSITLDGGTGAANNDGGRIAISGGTSGVGGAGGDVYIGGGKDVGGTGNGGIVIHNIDTSPAAVKDRIIIQPEENLLVNLDPGSGMQVNSTNNSPTIDMVHISNVGDAVVSPGVNALEIQFDAKHTDTAAMRIHSNSTEFNGGDNYRGLELKFDGFSSSGNLNEMHGIHIGAVSEDVDAPTRTVALLIEGTGNMATDWDVDIELQNQEVISNSVNGYMYFTGKGGAVDQQIAMDLDDTSPHIFSPTSTHIQINDKLIVDLGVGTGHAVCHSGTSNTVNDVELQDCTAPPAADYAEQYPVAAGITYGDIVVPGSVEVTTQDGQVITQLIKSSVVYQGPVAGIVSDNYGDFTSAGYNVDEQDNPMPVALVGRVPVNVTDENGPISVGDYLTTSSTPGKAMKATEAGRVIGMALNDFSEVSGQVMVQVNNSWNFGDILANDGSSTLITDKTAMASIGTATEENQTFDSYGLALRGSAWDGTQAQAVEMMLVNQVTDTDNYRLSIHNNQDAEVAYITNEGTLNLSGDLVLSGKIYPSDQGVAQTDKYIYYDGSVGAGGDFMRTNAKGWSTGSYDFAEMFPSTEELQAGDVVVFAGEGENVSRSTSTYDKKLAGIVSTRPGFLAGENLPNSHPIALAGRVPTKVVMENGPIEVGDPLTSSSTAGFAMKATDAGPIIGYALEPHNGGSDTKIIVFVNAGYWGGEPTDSAPGSENNASGFAQGFNVNYSALNMSGNIYMTGNEILSVGRIAAVGDIWELNSDGTIKTAGLVKTVIDSYQNTKVETVAVTSPEVMITLSGTTELVGDEVEVRFENVAPEYNDVISAIAPIRVVVTANGPVSLYVKEKDQNHFIVKRFGGEDVDVEFDWMVTAYRKGYEPEEEEEVVLENNEEEFILEVVEEVVEEVIEEVVEEEPVEEVIIQNDNEEVLGQEVEVEQVENSDEAVEGQINEEEVVEEEPATQESPDENQVDSPIEDEGGAQAEEPSESDVE